jgi:predicted transcriptional regulator
MTTARPTPTFHTLTRFEKIVDHNELLDPISLKILNMLSFSKRGMTIKELANDEQFKDKYKQKSIMKRLRYMTHIGLIRVEKSSYITAMGTKAYTPAYRAVPLEEIQQRVISQMQQTIMR